MNKKLAVLFKDTDLSYYSHDFSTGRFFITHSHCEAVFEEYKLICKKLIMNNYNFEIKNTKDIFVK